MTKKHLLGIAVCIHCAPELGNAPFIKTLQELTKAANPLSLELYLELVCNAATNEIISTGTSYGETLNNLLLTEYVKEQGFLGEMEELQLTPIETIKAFDL